MKWIFNFWHQNYLKCKSETDIIFGKLEKWYGRIESAQQLLHRTAFCRILELLEHLSMAVSITRICNTKMKLSFLQTLKNKY